LACAENNDLQSSGLLSVNAKVRDFSLV
jgi:hypothetical protein